jgi:DNA-binding FrmR family transcriptional regulator
MTAASEAPESDRLVNRLRRVEGQVRGLQRMIAEGKTCEDVLTQLAATRAALDRVGIVLITNRMRECLLEEERHDSDAAVERALETFLKYVQCVK